jgi:predicted nuclease of predicted toxin-antitoxin system
MGVSMSTVLALRETGEETVHLREQGLIRMPDEQILDKAIQEGRTILTFDLDFGELLAAAGNRVPNVILFRLRDQTPATVTRRLFQVLAECRLALEAGAIVIVEDGGYRVRRLPIIGQGNQPGG